MRESRSSRLRQSHRGARARGRPVPTDRARAGRPRRAGRRRLRLGGRHQPVRRTRAPSPRAWRASAGGGDRPWNRRRLARRRASSLPSSRESRRRRASSRSFRRPAGASCSPERSAHAVTWPRSSAQSSSRSTALTSFGPSRRRRAISSSSRRPRPRRPSPHSGSTLPAVSIGPETTRAAGAAGIRVVEEARDPRPGRARRCRCAGGGLSGAGTAVWSAPRSRTP